MGSSSVKNGTSKFYPVAEPDIGELEERYVLDAVRSGWVSSLGKYVDAFEQRFASYCGMPYGVATCNGTASLHLALLCLGVGPGDEVIVPDLTFVATANAVAYTGATPVFSDVSTESWCITAETVEQALSARTRAVIVVHLYGQAADMDPILELAGRKGISVIEDAAEAHGALYKERRVGGLGRIGIFSFYGNKTITTGEGGMLITRERELYQRARFLRDHAMSTEQRYFHPEVGYNYRLTNLQAALGLAQLDRIDELLAKKRAIMRWYKECLADCDLVLNPNLPSAENSYWMVSALLPKYASLHTVMSELHGMGIDTRPFFSPMHRLPAFRANYVGPADAGRFPISEELGARGFNLPSGVNLGQEDVRYIAETLKGVLLRMRNSAATRHPTA
jgi:perosamine synthetase